MGAPLRGPVVLQRLYDLTVDQGGGPDQIFTL